ncbi:MAG: VTT domain-containing protein [Planctomycetes bacterium]|nr:VTT domain-containing protein [Planctomycetota bacterium]
MRDLFRTALLMAVVLLIPVLPFLAFGPQMEAWVERWMKSPHSAPIAALAVVGFLTTDILLPVPSSVISTLGGWKLGVTGGTVASWLGMSLGAAIGFALARRWGRPFAAKFSREDELERMHRIAQQFGPAVLVLTRAVPVLAEAGVLLMGVHRLAWRRFLPPVLLANLGVSLAYSAFGQLAEQHGWLPLALGAAIALPVLFAALAERWLPR